MIDFAHRTAQAGHNDPSLSIVVAAAQNGVIGLDNAMPWRLSTDLKRFKALTLGRPVIMGRKTWDSIGRPLPGRKNIVITRDTSFSPDGADVAHSLDEAIRLASEESSLSGGQEICVIGGGEIYAQAITRADTLHITRVLADIAGDTRFPDIDPAQWKRVSTQHFPAGERDSHATRYEIYQRR